MFSYYDSDRNDSTLLYIICLLQCFWQTDFLDIFPLHMFQILTITKIYINIVRKSTKIIILHLDWFTYF